MFSFLGIDDEDSLRLASTPIHDLTCLTSTLELRLTEAYSRHTKRHWYDLLRTLKTANSALVGTRCPVILQAFSASELIRGEGGEGDSLQAFNLYYIWGISG